MIESYLLGLVTGFFLGVGVAVIPEKLKKVLEIKSDNYIDISSRH